MARLDLGMSLDDHPGYPPTPGLKDAVARVIGAQERHRLDTEARNRARRRSALMAQAGEELSRLLESGGIDEDAIPKDINDLLRRAREA